MEPIINSNVAAQLVNMRTVIGSIDPQLLSWFTSTERISASLTARPSPASRGQKARASTSRPTCRATLRRRAQGQGPNLHQSGRYTARSEAQGVDTVHTLFFATAAAEPLHDDAAQLTVLGTSTTAPAKSPGRVRCCWFSCSPRSPPSAQAC